MPARVIRKSKKHSKSRKHYSTKSKQRGGDPGRIAIPPEYFGKGMQGYYADGSTALNSSGNQRAVSQGVLSSNGNWAGPNLYPQLGGGCGCSGRRYMKPTHMSKKTKKRTTRRRH